MWQHSSGHITSGTTSPCLNLRPTSSRSSPCSFPTKPDCTTVRYGKTACGEDDVAVDNALLKPLAQKLVDTVLRFDEKYSALKREENALDFADTELFALQLLVEEPAADPFTRTELAETLREQFEEVLIDEYQDTNKLQDTIFSALSKDDLFMVGDV